MKHVLALIFFVSLVLTINLGKLALGREGIREFFGGLGHDL